MHEDFITPAGIYPANFKRPASEQFEVEDLPSLGWIQISEMGSENLYFTFENGTRYGYVKIY